MIESEVTAKALPKLIVMYIGKSDIIKVSAV